MNKLIKNKMSILFLIFFFGVILIDGLSERERLTNVNNQENLYALDY